MEREAMLVVVVVVVATITITVVVAAVDMVGIQEGKATDKVNMQ